MKNIKHPNRYHLFIETELAANVGNVPDNPNYKLGEQVRAAFVGLTNNLYDHLHIAVDQCGRITIKIVGSSFISLCGGNAFEFLDSSVFCYREQDKEPWSLSIDGMDDGFGCGMHVSAKTPRACVKAMISERKKFLKKLLKSLNKFRPFEDYTRFRHLC